MPDCAKIDSLVTPYIDGDLGATERRLVDDHVRACPPCHSRVAAERAVFELMRDRRGELAGGTASAALRERCVALRSLGAAIPGRAGRAAWRERLMPAALAAGIVVAVGAASVYLMTDRSSQLLAAELTADHVKCFGVESMRRHRPVDLAEAERKMASLGWHMPPELAAAGMELLGVRLCLYGRGQAAHLMYSHNGQPVSVFMIPEAARVQGVVDLMGHETAIWDSDGRTFVVVAREPEQRTAESVELSRMTAYVRAALH